MMNTCKSYSRFKAISLPIVLGLTPIMASSRALAGTGWYVTIINSDREVLSINFAGNDNWYCNDFCVNQKINPMSQRTFYTEEKESYVTNAAIQGIDLNGTHVELYQSGHTYSGTQLATTPIYTSYFLTCTHRSDAGISTDNLNTITVKSLDAGRSDACLHSGNYGTVRAEIIYIGR